jgi:hypothetical protein
MKDIEKISRVICNCQLISGLNDYHSLLVFCPQLPVALLVNGKGQHVASYRKADSISDIYKVLRIARGKMQRFTFESSNAMIAGVVCRSATFDPPIC